MKENPIGKKVFPYVVILILVILAEVFLFNLSTWKTMACDPFILSSGGKTDETGTYKTEIIPVNGEVKNVKVDLTVDHYDRADVSVFLSDAGNYYAYPLPVFTVASGLKGDGYQNLYPYGKVNTIQIVVTVPEGASAHIERITANVNRPMDFKILRAGILFVILSLGYLIFTDKALMRIPCIRGNKKQWVIMSVLMLGIMLLAGVLVRTNPVWTDPVFPHHMQYQELAHSLKEGTVVIDDHPDPALFQKENPYDTVALMAEGIPFKMDYAFYNGNYYAYFGIIPELLFFLPYYLIRGTDFPNYGAVLGFYILMIPGIFGVLWELIHRFGKKVPFIWYLILSISVCFLPNYVFILKRPDIYNIPVIAGNAFVFLGTYFWMKALWSEKYNCLWLSLGSLCMACIAGSRPQMFLYTVVIFLSLFVPELMKTIREWKAEKRLQIPWKRVFAFTIPFVLIAAVVIWYNMARFGSPVDFGATRSMTSNDMNNRGFNLSRLGRGLYSFLFQFPSIHASYPFLESCQLEGSYMGKNIVEFCFGGIFFIFPLLFGLIYVFLGGYKKYKKESNILIILLTFSSLFIAAFDINTAGILQRYMGDIVFGFVMAAVFILLYEMSSRRDSESYLWIAKGTYLAVIYSLCFSFLVFISSADRYGLEESNIVLAHQIQSYFTF